MGFCRILLGFALEACFCQAVKQFAGNSSQLVF